MNNALSPGEKRRIESLLGQGFQQAEIARIVKRSRMTITEIAAKARQNAVLESSANQPKGKKIRP